MRRIFTATAIIAGVGSSGAHAATATSSFNVTITIVAQCTVGSAGALAFASTGLLNSVVNQTSTFNVTCTNTTPYTVGLDNGQNVSGAQRRMKGGGTNSEFIAYNLFSDSSRTTAWGNVTGSWVSGVGTGASQTLTVYGQVPVQSTPSPGVNYADTVTITVTY